MKFSQCRIVQNCVSCTEANLIQAHAWTDQHRKGTWADFSVQWSRIARRYTVKFSPTIGDRTGQQIKATGRAFGIGHSVHTFRQRKAFHQRHYINAAFFQHSTICQVDAVHFKLFQAIRDLSTVARKERSTHAIGNITQTKIKAGWLNLRINNRWSSVDLPTLDHFADLLIWNDTGHKIHSCLNAKRPHTEGTGGLCKSIIGRASRTRTCDLPSPRRTRYQTAP